MDVMKTRIIVFTLFITGLFIGVACKDKLDAETVAQALADRLIECLNFDQPTTQIEEPLPKASDDGPLIGEAPAFPKPVSIFPRTFRFLSKWMKMSIWNA